MISNLIRDENGELSSTRFVMLSMLAAFWTALFVPVPEPAWSIINGTLLLCLGGTAARTTIKNMER